MSRYVTMKEIAAELGVSQSAVSFALNDRYDGVRISDEVRDKIKTTASKMGYARNAVVQSLVSGRTKLLAYISWDIGQREYIARNISGAVQKASKRGYLVKLLVKNDETKIEDIFNTIVEQRIEGICAQFHDSETIDFLIKNGREKGIPVVFVDQESRDEKAGIFVKSDDYPGIYDAVKCLYELGHRRIGHFALNPLHVERADAFNKAMKAFGLKVRKEDEIFTSHHLERLEFAKEIASRASKNRPSAFFCATDYHAAILSKEAWKKGIKIPEELSVIGFGKLNSIRTIYPELATVEQPFEELGEVAANMLIDEIELESKISFRKVLEERLPTKFISGETVGKAQAKRRSK